MEHRGISFSVVEMSFPRGWKWTVGKAKTVTVGVCATRLGPVDKPNPDPNGCKDDKGREALKEFIVARCDAP